MPDELYVTHEIFSTRCAFVQAYKEGDDQVDLLSDLPDVTGSENAGHADLGTF